MDEADQGRLEAENRALREANESLEAFAYVASHDLKEPVRAIDALLEALDEDEAHRLSDDGRELLAKARDAERRLSRLVDGLLRLSRASREELREAAQPIRLADALLEDEAAVRFQRVAAERGVRLEVALGGAPPVRAAPGALAQVLGNLVLNAIQHNPRPDPLVRVHARRDPEDPGFVRIAVEDNGGGLPSRVRSWLEGDAPLTTSQEGGFGLLIARRTVERLGGRLWAGVSPEGGATLYFTLPAA